MVVCVGERNNQIKLNIVTTQFSRTYQNEWMGKETKTNLVKLKAINNCNDCLLIIHNYINHSHVSKMKYFQ